MFVPAKKVKSYARLAIMGPAGSGKTYTALAIMSHMAEKIAVIDTEHGSSAKYANIFNFDMAELKEFDPRNYIDAIKAAQEAGYDGLIIDSLSHAWMGKGGALEMVENIGQQMKGGSFAAWSKVTPIQNELMDTILAAPMHVVATLRSKMEYTMDDSNGRKEVVKLGMKPVQRDGVEYEFDVVLDMDFTNTATVTKSRCPALTGRKFVRPGEEIAVVLKEWLDGEDPEKVKLMGLLLTLAKEKGIPIEQAWLEKASKEEIIARGKELRAMK